MAGAFDAVSSYNKEAQAILAKVDALNLEVEARRKSIDASVEGYEATLAMSKAVTESTRAINADAFNFAASTVSGFAGSMWSAAEAAMAGQKSFGEAMKEMTRQTLLGIAQQATVKSLFYMAEYIASWGADVTKLKASLMMGGVAVMAGAGGLGMTGASRGGSAGVSRGSGGGGFSSGASGGGGSNSGPTYVDNIYSEGADLTTRAPTVTKPDAPTNTVDDRIVKAMNDAFGKMTFTIAVQPGDPAREIIGDRKLVGKIQNTSVLGR